VIRIVLPWPPSVNRYWRSVNGRAIISREGRDYRAAVISRAYAMLAVQHFGNTERLRATIHASPPDRRKRDLDNLLKAPLDAMQHAGVIADDSLIDDLRIIRGPIVAGGRLVVEITAIEGGE
jgi:crossover junction endodeoxyribonuclease RusA